MEQRMSQESTGEDDYPETDDDQDYCNDDDDEVGHSQAFRYDFHPGVFSCDCAKITHMKKHQEGLMELDIKRCD